MLIPKESDQLLCTSRSSSNMDPDNVETPDANCEKSDCRPPPENIQVITITNLKPEQTIINGTVNGEVKPPASTKCMNILQNIIIKKEDIQIPIKREYDEDTLHHRIKIPRRDTGESSVASTHIKEEILDIRSELHEALSGNTTEGEAASESKTEVHTCFRCNMIFMEKKAFTVHSKECGKTFAPEEAHTTSCNTTSCNSSANTHCNGKTNSYLLHLDQLPRLIESVRNTPCLYNTDIEGYNNVELKEQMWARIAADCNFVSGKIAKGTWKKLQQEFCDSLNKRQSGSTAREPYRYEQQMQFILPYVENVKPSIVLDDTYTSIYSSHGNFTAATIPNEIIEDVDDAQLHVPSPPKRQRVSTPFVLRQTERDPPPPPLPPANSGRALDLFFMSMCESAKGLPFHLQLQVKKKVFEAVYEAEEIVDRGNNITNIRTEPFSPPQTPGEDQFQY